MSPELLDEWAEFSALEPWGFPLADVQVARLMATIFQAAGAKDVTAKPFLLDREEDEEQDMDKLWAALDRQIPPDRP